MFKKIQHTNKTIAEQIYNVFQLSYVVEAKILQADNFPPLRRTVTNFMLSDTVFFGFHVKDAIAAVVEIKQNTDFVHIQSLVVLPDFFKQGIAFKMMSEILSLYGHNDLMVETGVDNQPAINLYEKCGFKQIKQWDTNHGVRKVRLFKSIK